MIRLRDTMGRYPISTMDGTCSITGPTYQSMLYKSITIVFVYTNFDFFGVAFKCRGIYIFRILLYYEPTFILI
jgi:hypothetical protein